jgi:hypothetical protein
VDEHARLWLAIGHCFVPPMDRPGHDIDVSQVSISARHGSPKPTMSNLGCRSVFFSRLNGLNSQGRGTGTLDSGGASSTQPKRRIQDLFFGMV